MGKTDIKSRITIEKVNRQDASQLLEIYAPYVENTAISFEVEVPSLQEFENRICRISSRYPYVKAVDEKGHIAGYAYADAFKNRAAYDWAVETTIYIRSECRRTGVGRLLYQALEEALKRMGILNMNACIAMPVNPDSHLTKDSFLFHEKMGFLPVGTFHQCGYKFDTWYDMIWMEKMLGEHTKLQDPVRFGGY